MFSISSLPISADVELLTSLNNLQPASTGISETLRSVQSSLLPSLSAGVTTPLTAIACAATDNGCIAPPIDSSNTSTTVLNVLLTESTSPLDAFLVDSSSLAGDLSASNAMTLYESVEPVINPVGAVQDSRSVSVHAKESAYASWLHRLISCLDNCMQRRDIDLTRITAASLELPRPSSTLSLRSIVRAQTLTDMCTLVNENVVSPAYHSSHAAFLCVALSHLVERAPHVDVLKVYC